MQVTCCSSNSNYSSNKSSRSSSSDRSPKTTETMMTRFMVDVNDEADKLDSLNRFVNAYNEKMTLYPSRWTDATSCLVLAAKSSASATASSSVKTKFPFGKCRVCGDTSTGNHCEQSFFIKKNSYSQKF